MGRSPNLGPKSLKQSRSLHLEILTILSPRLHSPGIQRTSLSQIFQLSVVTIQYCRWLYRSINPAQKMQWIKVGSPCGVFICQHDCYLCRQSGTRLWEPIPGPKTLTQTMGFAAGLLKALKSQEICLNNFHPSLSRIWPYLDFDNPATRDKPASSYRSEACILIFHNFVYSDISSLKVRTFWRFPPEQGMGLRMALNSCLM